MRFIVGGLPVFAFGFGLLYERVRQHRALALACVGCLLLFGVWNQLLLYQYFNGLIPRSQPMTWEQFVPDKFRLATVRRAEQLIYGARDRYIAGDMEGYYALAKEAQQLDPAKPRTNLALGLAAIQTGRPDVAKQCFAWLHAFAPQESVFLQGLVWSLGRRGAMGRSETGVGLLQRTLFESSGPAHWLRKASAR